MHGTTLLGLALLIGVALLLVTLVFWWRNNRRHRDTGNEELFGFLSQLR
ncbi:MAG: hypothetical protein HKP13_05135, partial [Gammaproteobacteria bacterium]|nr:hypothetical protein [Gammaproteobacteria bacterium]